MCLQTPFLTRISIMNKILSFTAAVVCKSMGEVAAEKHQIGNFLSLKISWKFSIRSGEWIKMLFKTNFGEGFSCYHASWI